MLRRTLHRILPVAAPRTRKTREIYEGIPRYPEMSVLGGLRALDYFGTAAFAVGGSMVAAQCGLTATGCTVVGTITAVGGGCIRDVVFDKHTFVMDEPEYLYISFFFAGATFGLAYLGGFPFSSDVWQYILWWADTIGLAAFTVIGTMFGVRLYLGVMFSVICGVLTATGGGVIRDVICRRPPRVFHNLQEAYSETALAGSLAYLLLRGLDLAVPFRVVGGVSTTIAARVLADNRQLRIPHAPQLPK